MILIVHLEILRIYKGQIKIIMNIKIGEEIIVIDVTEKNSKKKLF